MILQHRHIKREVVGGGGWEGAGKREREGGKKTLIISPNGISYILSSLDNTNYYSNYYAGL